MWWRCANGTPCLQVHAAAAATSRRAPQEVRGVVAALTPEKLHDGERQPVNVLGCDTPQVADGDVGHDAIRVVAHTRHAGGATGSSIQRSHTHVRLVVSA